MNSARSSGEGGCGVVGGMREGGVGEDCGGEGGGGGITHSLLLSFSRRMMTSWRVP